MVLAMVTMVDDGVGDGDDGNDDGDDGDDGDYVDGDDRGGESDM
jgi:hypothetical protein